MLKRTLLTVALITPAFGHAAVYQCKVNGQMVFSDQPCGESAKKIEVQAPPVSGGGSMVSGSAQQFMAERDKKRKIQLIDRKIEDQEKRKTIARRAMDDALIRYQRQKAYANNNLAGAVWESSLADEAEVLRQRFQAEIDSADREIDRLRAERLRILQTE